MNRQQKILIVRLSSMGDIVHCLPVASSLKSKFPDAFIGWAVEDGFKELLTSIPFIDRIYVMKTKRWRQNLKYNTLRELSSAIKEIRDVNFDIAIDAQGLLKSGVITYLSGAPLRIGFSRWHAKEPMSALFINQKITPPKELIHIIDQNLYLIRDLIGNMDSPYPRLFVSEKDDAWATRELKGMGIMNGDLKVLINPGAGWETKLWNPGKYKDLAKELYKRFQARVILNGNHADKELIGEIKEGLPFSVPQFIDYSITQMMAIFKNMDLVIGGDTGPIHVASALGIPTLSLYGPSNARRSGPRGEGHESIQSGLPCSPCFDRQCRLTRLNPEPVSGKEVPCMYAISLEEVVAKLEKILRRNIFT